MLLYTPPIDHGQMTNYVTLIVGIIAVDDLLQSIPDRVVAVGPVLQFAELRLSGRHSITQNLKVMLGVV